jgi:NADH dehydrogenase FAD-containing subunit
MSTTAEPVAAANGAPAAASNGDSPKPVNGSTATKTILVLGASNAGIAATHYILRHIVPSLPDRAAYRVVLVDPSTKWFNRVGAPRAVLSETRLPLSKVMLDTSAGFTEYAKGGQFRLLEGRATALDTDARTVTIAGPDGAEEQLHYYALIIATGADSMTPLLGAQAAHPAASEAAIAAFRAALPAAKSIVVAGGGPAGVETAAELGFFLNGNVSRSKPAKARITLVTNGTKLLPVLREQLAKRAEGYLARVGVEVRYEAAVAATEPADAGRLAADGSIAPVTQPAKVRLANGETLEADLYVPAMGLTPNAAWLPERLRAEDGRVRVADDGSLRVPGAGERVFALGEVGAYGKGGIADLYAAVPVAMTNLKRDLLHAASGKKERTGKDMVYKDEVGETQAVPVGGMHGVGAMKGWRIPEMLLWLVKGRDFMVFMNPYALKGAMWKSETKWKDM